MTRVQILLRPLRRFARPAPGRVPQILLIIGILALAEAPIAWTFLVTWPGDQWQVDVEVYREAGRSILAGRPVYEHLTESPQLLPFTYPPFAALLAMPLALIPFGAVGWLWTAAQVAATYATVLLAFRQLLRRAGSWRWVAGALLCAPMLWLTPVSDGVRFGQVNAFLVLAVLADFAVTRPPWARGVLVGLATAIKLTPGLFWVHCAVVGRWQQLKIAIATAATVTIATVIVLPEASLAFWGEALRDPSRLGPNAGTSNQSLRGVILRLGPDGLAGSALWLAVALPIAGFGLWLARRAFAARNPVAEVATVGLLAVLLSPVSWVHHLAWVVVLLGAILGSGHSLRQFWLFAGLYLWFLLRLPWLG
ncbi:MAG: glycosyltransferase 87 family protein, partial [Angustibacter sp.]